MARSLRLEYEGAIYHVTARGNERGVIFRDDGDGTRNYGNGSLAQKPASNGRHGKNVSSEKS